MFLRMRVNLHDSWRAFSHGELHTSYRLLELPNLIGSPHNSAMVRGSLTKQPRGLLKM